jgi:hypothetical protein
MGIGWHHVPLAEPDVAALAGFAAYLFDAETPGEMAVRPRRGLAS